MIETFITSLFSDPQRRFGDILEDLVDTDDPDDDWMRETLYDLEIGQIVKAGMKVMGLGGASSDSADDEFTIVTTEEEDGTTYSLADEPDEDDDVEPADPPKKKKKKKKKKKAPKDIAEAAPKKTKKKKKPKVVPAKRSDAEDEEEADPEWVGYLKLIIKALRAAKAYDGETAVNNGVILNHIHGEDNWDKDESADLRRGMEELIEAKKADKVGQRRGTRYHLN
jgi:hypothetical protein